MSTGWTLPPVEAPIQLVLADGVRDAATVASTLNEARIGVRASVDHGAVVVASDHPLDWQGIPVYSSARPRFQGQVVKDRDGRLVLAGSMERPAVAELFFVIGSVIVGLVFLALVLVQVSGDPTGPIGLAFGVVFVLALLVTFLIDRRLTHADESLLFDALRHVGDGPQN